MAGVFMAQAALIARLAPFQQFKPFQPFQPRRGLATFSLWKKLPVPFVTWGQATSFGKEVASRLLLIDIERLKNPNRLNGWNAGKAG